MFLLTLRSFNLLQGTVAENGIEALRITSERHFDVILMDVQMPIMDGITATEELRKRGVTTPIIGLTANADDLALHESLRAGMNELLTKPISLSLLRTTLDRYRPRRSISS